MEDKFLEVISQLSDKLYLYLNQIDQLFKSQINEIRLRVNQPIILHSSDTFFFLSNSGRVSKTPSNLKIISQKDITDSIGKMCEYSLYSYQEQIKNGYITLKGGHRVGISGTGIISENGTISNIRDISSMNIRIARQIKGTANTLFKKVGENFTGILIIGPPNSGKTTILRDIARSCSIGKFFPLKKVCVIDQRNELSATCCGAPGFDLGFSDILSSYPKDEGIMHCIKGLSPDIIVCDEIGSLADIAAIKQGVNSGVKIIASMHAFSIEELLKKNAAQELLKTGAFDKIVLLGNNQTLGEILGIFKVGDLIDKTYRNVSFNKLVCGNRIQSF